ncbi:MAG: hypothetical protein ABSF67_23955 [Roseiarcus sp.]
MRDTLINGSGFFHSASVVRTMSMSETEALLISMAIEGPVAWAIVVVAAWPSRGALHAGAASMVATAVTHPQMWTLAIWSYGRFPYWPAILTIEALVVVVEAVLIAWMARLTPARSGIVSLAANSASFLFGLWLGA